MNDEPYRPTKTNWFMCKPKPEPQQLSLHIEVPLEPDQPNVKITSCYTPITNPSQDNLDNRFVIKTPTCLELHEGLCIKTTIPIPQGLTVEYVEPIKWMVARAWRENRVMTTQELQECLNEMHRPNSQQDD